MRERLYRAKCADGRGWVYGIPHGNIMLSFDKWQSGAFRVEAYIDPETVCEFTGLTDRGGVKIFEGDIVKTDKDIFYVKFGKCGGVPNADNYGYMGFYFEPYDEKTKEDVKYGLRNDICFFTNKEVIGNIFDNPELAGGKQN